MAVGERGRSGEKRHGILDEMHGMGGALSRVAAARICVSLHGCLERVRWDGRLPTSSWAGYCQ